MTEAIKPDSSTNTDEKVATAVAAAKTPPKTAVIFTFTSGNGGTYVHPLPPRVRFSPGVDTPHEMDTWCENMVASGHLRVV